MEPGLNSRRIKTQKIIDLILGEAPMERFSPPGEGPADQPPLPPRARSTPKDEMVPEKTEGWVMLHRKSIYSQVFQNEGLWKIWTWCLLKANHKDRWIPIKTGRGGTEVLVKRGQFVFGRKTAAKELKMRPTTVQDRIKKLVNMQNLVTQSVTHYSIVTVCNYKFYQAKDDNEVSPNPSTIRQPSVTTNNDKNDKKETLRDSPNPAVREFIDFWYQTFKKKFGEPYPVSGAKEGRLAKGLLKTYSIGRLEALSNAFFRSTDLFIQQSGYTIGTFKSQITKLIAQEARVSKDYPEHEMIRRLKEGKHDNDSAA